LGQLRRTGDCSMARKPGTKNRNYPPLTLADAMKVPRAIEDQASGMTVSRLTLAELLNSTPTSRVFKELVAASRFYGLTTGGINATEFGLTKLGEEATGGDEVARATALKAAVMNVPPFKAFFEKFAGKKMPGSGPFKEFLIRDAEVPEEKADECMGYITSDAETAGLVRSMKGGTWVDVSGTPPPVSEDQADDEGSAEEDDDGRGRNGGPPELPPDERPGVPEQPETKLPPVEAKKVFIAHGKNRTPLEQLKKALDQFKVKYAVAIDEPHAGRPISKKVAQLMQEECSSGIFIFTADEQFLHEDENGDTQEVWRPSENVVFELGAASILYENRIVIFKEKGVTFPSDFSDLGYIEFEKDQLVAELGSLFSELVGLDILEVRAKG
jgi:hypothetical protein